MVPGLLVVDAAHVLACAGRALGAGARRRRDAWDLSALCVALQELTAGSQAALRVLWFDGSVGQVGWLPSQPGVDVHLVPVKGGRQRGLEVLALSVVLREAAPGDVVWLAGDPLRHRVLLAELTAQGTEARLVGISYGEPTPAEQRVWLRRDQVARCLLKVPAAVGVRPDSAVRPAYRRPSMRPA